MKASLYDCLNWYFFAIVNSDFMQWIYSFDLSPSQDKFSQTHDIWEFDSQHGHDPRFQERCHPSRLYTRGLEEMIEASLQRWGRRYLPSPSCRLREGAQPETMPLVRSTRCWHQPEVVWINPVPQNLNPVQLRLQWLLEQQQGRHLCWQSLWLISKILFSITYYR